MPFEVDSRFPFIGFPTSTERASLYYSLLSQHLYLISSLHSFFSWRHITLGLIFAFMKNFHAAFNMLGFQSYSFVWPIGDLPSRIR